MTEPSTGAESNKQLDSALDAFIEAYEAFLAEAADYPDDKQDASGACGEWSPRQILAHMAGWLVEAQRRFRRYGKGTGEVTYNTDAFNEVSLWQRKDTDYADILAELQTERAKIQTAISELSDTRREDERYIKWLNALANDARNHLNDLQNFNHQD